MKSVVQSEKNIKFFVPEVYKAVLDEPRIPLLVVDDEEIALKVWGKWQLPCIAITHDNNNNEGLVGLDQIALKNRTMYVLCDNSQLVKKLKKEGAEVSVARIPEGEDLGGFLEKYGVEQLYKMLAASEGKALPVEVLSLAERIAEATQENYQELISEIADVDDEIEKEILVKALSKKIKIGPKIVRRVVDKTTNTITEDSIVIAHPAYEVNSDFLSLGFRETVVKNDHPLDRNFFVLSMQGGYTLHSAKVFQHVDRKIIFDERNRLLLRADDRWPKQSILAFIRNPVSPEGVYREVKQILRQYVEFQKEEIYGLITAWILATYFFQIFHAIPFLFIYGKKQSGKTRLLDLLERLAFNAMKIKGISVASMADSIDGVRGTFLNDQAESLSDNRNIELLGILTDSYTTGGGKRRIVDISNKGRRVMEFGTFAPKAFASVKEIDTDLKDRCIQVVMVRAMEDYPYPEAFLAIWPEMRDKLYRLLLTKWQEVREIYQTTGEGVSHRVRELWRPIETILRVENVPNEEKEAVKKFFLESMQETQSELTDSEIEVFELLLERLEESQEAILTAEDIAKSIRTRPYEDMTEKGLQTWVGRIFRQFSLYDAQAGRKNKKRAYHFSYRHVKNIFDRYHLTSGISGQVVKTVENQPSTVDHLKNRGGNGSNEVVSLIGEVKE